MTRLDLSGNPLGAIGREHFVNLTSLLQLRLSNMTLKEVDPAAFRQLRRLTELDLSFNYLSSLPSAVLEPVAQTLEILRLDHNDLNLTSGIDGSLERLVNLKELSLGGNRNASTIKLGSGFAGNLATLKKISFAGNRIDKIEFDTFEVLRPRKQQKQLKKLPSLEELDLSYCNLTYIHPDAFQFLPPHSFRLLNLSFNPLLTQLDLGGHFHIRNILHGLEVVPSLKSLDLSGLGLTEVTNETFDFLSTTGLTELRLSDNELTEFDDALIGRDLPMLKKIDLSHNYVETVAGLESMTWLEEVLFGMGRVLDREGVSC